MHYLFLTYATDDYFLAHVYEQLLAIELLHYGYTWKRGNLGAGYIEVAWDKTLPREEIERLMDLPDLNPVAVKSAYGIVKKETERNLITKPFVEILNFRLNSLSDIRGHIKKPVQIEAIRTFLEQEKSRRSYVIVQDTQIAASHNWPPAKEAAQNFQPPYELMVREKNSIFRLIHTNAQDHIDGLIIEKWAHSIVTSLLQEDIITTYQTIIDPDKELWVAFLMPVSKINDFHLTMSRTSQTAQIAGDRQNPDGNPLIGEIYQLLDWGHPLDSKLEKDKLGIASSCSFRLIAPELSLDWKLS